MSDRFERRRHSSCAKRAMSRRLASGTRTGLPGTGGPSGIGEGSTTGAGPRWPRTTWPTSEVWVLVERRSLLLS